MLHKFKRLRILAFFISVLILISLVDSTFAKYLTEAAGTTNLSIARWRIVINDQDIVSNNYITNTITPIYLENAHVSSGVFAPGVVGYFDLVIDTSEVDVSFEYKISTEINSESSVSDIKVTGYTINGGPIVEVDSQLNEIGQTVLHTDEESIRTIRVYITWDISEDRTMDNEQNTLAALSQEKAKLDVSLNFTQIID